MKVRNIEMGLLLKIILLVIAVILFFVLGTYKKENGYEYGFKFNKKHFLALIPVIVWVSSLFFSYFPKILLMSNNDSL